MATSVIPHSNGYISTDQEKLAEYSKLIRLRNDVAANSNQSHKVGRKLVDSGNALSATGTLSATSPPQPTNGYHKPLGSSKSTSTSPAYLHAPDPPSNPFQQKPPSVQQVPTTIPGPSNIDPIFLTKSDILVRAERRQRIERALEEQLHQKKHRRFLDQETLPDFNVAEVLKRAQELVKPFKLHDKSHTNGTASSSDSFDENTFYSSQMNESTTTEEVAESSEWRPQRVCSYTKKGQRCINGRDCKYSHDPAMMRKHEADGSQAMDLDSVDADEQTSLRQNDPISQHTAANSSRLHSPAQENPSTAALVLTEKERIMQERIAQLEAELRHSKAGKIGQQNDTARQNPKETHDSQEESAYSPPPPDEFGRHAGLREPEKPRPSRINRQQPAHGQSAREYGRLFENPPSPVPNNMRVIRNHITSPVAPQPARVSPLAMAKVPQVSQIQRDHGESRRPSRASNLENLSAGQSPNIIQQPPSSKKRRRAYDSGDELRIVAPRRDISSPVVRIKEEPMSPPPFATSGSGLRQVQQRPDSSRPLYVDAAVPQYREEEPVFQQARVVDRHVYSHGIEDRAPLTPTVRRVISQNDQHYIANEEQDLRRVVSARHVRAPMSPAPYAVQHSAPQSRTTRAVSQVYLSPTGQSAAQLHRASVQPHPVAHVPHDRSPSPPLSRVPQSPPGRQPLTMAPPPRRIIIDQYGNRFLEAPVHVERQVSVAPGPRGTAYEPRYEQVTSRSASVRQPQLVSVDEGHYVRRAPSTVPYEYARGPRIRQVVGPQGDVYEDDQYVPRDDGSHVAEYAGNRQTRHYEEAPVPQERIVRMQSVRPVERQYEVARENVTRVQSVRPQPRIVSLGEKPVRQISVRPENGSVRQMSYAVEDRPRYQYAGQGQDRSFVEEVQDDVGLYEAPGSGGRRIIQRM